MLESEFVTSKKGYNLDDIYKCYHLIFNTFFMNLVEDR